MVRSISIGQLEEFKEHTILDVRTPLEFLQAHIPGAINIPLLSNIQRVIVGTTYKKEGREKAILKGLELTGPKWADLVRETEQKVPNKQVIVHCWRGGMRSGAMAWILDLYGFNVSVIRGGYKAYRTQLIPTFETPYALIMLSGRTGSGKTITLQALQQAGEQVVDLEALANHQGSSFGSMGTKIQPTQEQFENNLFDVLQRLDKTKAIWVESESVMIGRCCIPRPFFDQMNRAEVIDIQISEQERIEFLYKEYGGLDKKFLERALLGISKRLGPLQTKEALKALEEDRMKDFIAWALTYYDKLYRNSLSKRTQQNILGIELEKVDATKNAGKILEHLRNKK